VANIYKQGIAPGRKLEALGYSYQGELGYAAAAPQTPTGRRGVKTAGPKAIA